MATVPAGTKFLGVDPSFTDLTEKKGTKVDRQTEYFSLEDITATVGVGSEGPQGIQGPEGPPGPVGPAGLEWQGAWDTNSSYAVNDAVGFNGASWFCISEVTGTGNSNPEEDTTHWALLAAQGATGPQGAQGPTGPQGPAGPSGAAAAGTSGTVTAGVDFPYPTLQYSINRVVASASDVPYRTVLPAPSTIVIGQKVIVMCTGSNKVTVKAVQSGSGGIYINGRAKATVGEFNIYPNETYELTYIGSGNWVSYFEEPKVQYKSYIAQIIPVDASNITVNVLENTLGTTVTASWSSGKINITLGAELITLTNSYLSSSNYLQSGIYHITTPTLLGFDLIELASYKVSGTPSAGWSFGAIINFELRLYN